MNMKGLVISGMTSPCVAGRQRCKPSLISVIKALIWPRSRGQHMAGAGLVRLYTGGMDVVASLVYTGNRTEPLASSWESNTQCTHYGPSLPLPLHPAMIPLLVLHLILTLYCSFILDSCGVFYVCFFMFVQSIILFEFFKLKGRY